MAKVAKSPAFQLYPRDILVDCQTMTNEEFGIYCRLLFYAWIGVEGAPQAHLVDDDETLRRLVAAKKNEWKSSSLPALRRFEKVGNGLLAQRRLLDTKAEQVAATERRSAAAGKRWKPVESDAMHMQCSFGTDALQCSSSASSSASASATAVEEKEKNPHAPLPDGSRLSALGVGVDAESVPPLPAPAPKPKAAPVAKAATWRDVPIPAALQTPEFAAAWQEWHEYRRESKYRTWSARTASGSLSDLAALGVKAAVASIGKAISSGWQGIHPKAESAGSPRNAPPSGVAVLPSSDADRRDGACRYNAAAKHMERWSADRRVWEPMAPAVLPTAAASTTTTTATGANS